MKHIMQVLIGLICLFMWPNVSFAQSYTVTDVSVQAELQPSGDVKVTEQHEYEFTGAYNGMTREMYVKPGTTIQHFQATSKGKPLKVKREDATFYVHRQAEDETVPFELTYTLTEAVQLFEDAGQFDWTFFDENNETDYEKLVITYTTTTPVNFYEAWSYDDKEGVLPNPISNGVRFSFGGLEAGEQVSVRFLTDRSYFTGRTTESGLAIQQMKEEQEQRVQATREKEQQRETTRSIGTIVVGSIGSLLIGGISWLMWRARQKREQFIESCLPGTQLVPDRVAEMPLLLYVINHGVIPPTGAAAILLDLVRKKKVKQVDDELFEVLDRTDLLNYESLLLSFLFDEIAQGDELHLGQIESYANQPKNYERYQALNDAWQQAVEEEAAVYEWKQLNLMKRVPFILTAATLFGGAILFGSEGLLLLMTSSIILGLLAVFVAILIPGFSDEAREIQATWRYFNSEFDKLTIEDWHRFTPEEKQVILIYAVGINNKGFTTHFQQFAKAEQRLAATPHFTGDFMAPFIYYNIATTPRLFVNAQDKIDTSSSASSASSSSYTGGAGTGGSGGGSGAF